MNEELNGKFTSRITVNIVLGIALVIYLAIFNFVCGLTLPQQTTIHWIPIAVCAVVFIFAGGMCGVVDFNNTHWKQQSKGSRLITFKYSPIGKTEAEVDAFIKKHYKEDGYASSDRTLKIAFLVMHAIILGVAAFISPYTLNAICAFPIWILVTLIIGVPDADSYIREAHGEDWKSFVCPHCKAIYGRYSYSTSNHSESQWISSGTVKKSDKVTDGINTVWVDRTETVYNTNRNSSFDMNFSCPRCKKQIVKKFSYTETTRI